MDDQAYKKKRRVSTLLIVIGAVCVLSAGWEFATGMSPPSRRGGLRRVGPNEPFVLLIGGLVVAAGGCICRAVEW